jgi:hypothetical protein
VRAGSFEINLAGGFEILTGPFTESLGGFVSYA